MSKREKRKTYDDRVGLARDIAVRACLRRMARPADGTINGVLEELSNVIIGVDELLR